MPSDPKRPDPKSEPRHPPFHGKSPGAPPDSVYRQIITMVDPSRFFAATAAVYKLLDDNSVRYEKREPISDLGVVPIELADGQDTSAVLESLNASPEVKVAELNAYFSTTETLVPPPMSVNDPLYRYQWALFKIGTETAWAHPAASTPVVVAILDTGISTAHPDLAPHLWDDGAGNHGFNYLTWTHDVEDEDGHGTLLAGTVAAVSNNYIGIAGTPWPIQLMAVKFHDTLVRPNALNALYAIGFALTNGANVITAAWHIGLRVQSLQLAIYILDLAGIVFVAGAGNDGLNNDVLPTYPATYAGHNVISVMATDEHDSKPGFSNYGKTTVHLGAPGTRILSTDCFFTNRRWRNYTGTSPACAFVASAAAALKSMNPAWTPKNIRDQLVASVRKIPRWLPCIAEGRLDLAAAVCGPLLITAPLPGDVWTVGMSVTVKWTASYATPGCTTVSILLSRDGGATYPTTIATARPVGSSPFSFTVPGPASLSARIRVVSDQGPGLFDQSGIFTMV